MIYKINKDIAIKQKFAKFIYLETIVWLIISGIFLSITSLFFQNLIVKTLYIGLGLIFTFLLLLPSPKNPGKSILTSINYFKKRYKKTVVTIDKLAEEKIVNINIDDKELIKREKKLRKKVKKTTLDYIDFRFIKDGKFIKHKDGSLIEILEIVPLNLNNINPNFKQDLINKNGDFYIAYSNDIKLIYLNYPNDFEKQKSFLMTKMEKEKNNFKNYMLKLKLEELEILENFKYKKSFFLMIFGSSEIDLVENIKRIKDNFPLKLKDTDKVTKEKIYFKLNNLNSNF
ncbi:MAG: hypothetical protein SOR31_04195 [Parvimonas sp.]|uniref:hypothetical protein n=1 Tax=Parvimonas sp. TaxID=1944660 RepID=UPI002A763AEF|nr:hypothetical protein [Parvimonas sp.]MDY3050817.1 hypothetical protein [Parvimonas sp.]